MNSKRLLAAGVAALIGLAAATSGAQAEPKNSFFKGTRGQVRSACGNVGGTLIEGRDHTTCVNNDKGTGVTCDNKGDCVGSYGDLRVSLDPTQPMLRATGGVMMFAK